MFYASCCRLYGKYFMIQRYEAIPFAFVLPERPPLKGRPAILGVIA